MNQLSKLIVYWGTHWVKTAWYKRKFVKQYNPMRTQSGVISEAVNSAVRRNLLYQPNTRIQDRDDIHIAWSEFLVDRIPKYTVKQNVAEYEADILELQTVMNNRFGAFFQQTGFRVSHAQKSLSVFLKHLWCLKRIPIPPQCPVDRIILQEAGIRNVNWTTINTIEEHRDTIRLLESTKPKYQPLAEWELWRFKGVPPAKETGS